MKIVIKTLPAATNVAKKTGLTLTALKTERVIKESIQKFFITHTDKSIIIKHNDMSFGYMNNEVIQRNTQPKEQEQIRKILNFIKQLRKSNVAYADIATRLNVAIFAETIKVFVNKINKPVDEVVTE